MQHELHAGKVAGAEMQVQNQWKAMETYFYARVLSQKEGELGTIPFCVMETKTHTPSAS